MKNSILAFTILSAIVTIGVILVSKPSRANAAEDAVPDSIEYATLRWAGRENLHLIRPSGNVEFLGRSLMSIKRPDRADDHSFYMNIAMNALAKEGYELVSMTSDDYVFKRKTRGNR
jgi:hypothetical protein